MPLHSYSLRTLLFDDAHLSMQKKKKEISTIDVRNRWHHMSTLVNLPGKVDHIDTCKKGLDKRKGMGRLQQLVFKKSDKESSGKQRRVSVDIGPEDWPNDRHMATPAPSPSADCASYQLLSDLREMKIYLPGTGVGVTGNGVDVTVDEAAAQDRTSPSSDTSDSVVCSPTATAAVSFSERTAPKVDEVVTSPLCGSPFRVLRVHMPTQTELEANYPEALASQLRLVSMQTLKVMFYPRILLRLRLRSKQRWVEASKDSVPKLTTAFVATVPLFKGWPGEALQAVIDECSFGIYDPRTYIAYEGEPPKALVFIASGTCELLTRLTHSSKVPTALVAPDAVGRKQQAAVANVSLPPTYVVASSRDKRYAAHNIHNPMMALSPAVFGAVNLLTNEPYTQTLRSLSKVETFTLTRDAFYRILSLNVPPRISSVTISTAFEKRNERMRKRFPITVDHVRRFNLFARVSNEFAVALLDKLEPNAIPASFTLLGAGQTCEAMHFLQSGFVGVYKRTDSSLSSTVASCCSGSFRFKRGGDDDDNVEKLMTKMYAPALLGDSALMYNSANEYSIVTLTDCDAYVLSKAHFSQLCRQNPSDVDTMLDAARGQRKEELKTNHLKFRSLLANLPMLRDIVEPHCERDFLNLFTPRSYRPLSCVCSTSEFCDRILVLTKGKIVIGDEASEIAAEKLRAVDEQQSRGADDGSSPSTHMGVLTATTPHCTAAAGGRGGHVMKRWESIGWSCCVPHRWGQTAMTLERSVETLELHYLDLMLFLHEKGHLQSVTNAIKVLMFPRAHPKEAVARVRSLVGPHVPMYPISRSLHINMYELGFCTVHMSAVAEAQAQQQQAAEAARNALLMANGSTRHIHRLTNSIWVHRQKK